MTLHSDDIKIFKADTPTDDADGGGLQTNNEVLDGVDNNVFPDISQLDGVYGRSHLRKVFAAVKAKNTDSLLGAHFIFTEVPKDPKVHVCAFQTSGSAGDRRAQAQAHVERYLAEGPLFIGALLEKQLKGQRAIVIVTVPAVPAPVAGNSIVLSHHEGFVGAYSEFVRVISITSVIREFVVDEEGNTKPLAVHTCELSSAIRNDYHGFTPREVLMGQDNVFKDKTRIRETRVADASKYYSARPLAKPALRGQASITVDTIYTYIVPSAQSELALVDMSIMGRTTTMVPSGSTQKFTTNLTVGSASANTVIGSGIARGSLKIKLSNGDVVLDDGAGLLNIGTRNVGTVRYDTGLATWVTTIFTHNGPAEFEFTPAFPNAQAQYTDFINVSEANRGLMWVYTLSPKVARGTLQIVYTFSGRNYILYDNGDGTISGVTSGVGSGTINYETSTFSITLNAYPDMGSAIIMQWGDKLVSIDATDKQDTKLKAVFDGGLSTLSPKRNMLEDPTITWDVDGVGFTATVNKDTGVISGDAEGVITSGEQVFIPKKVAPVGTVFNTSGLLDPGDVEDIKVVSGSVLEGVISFPNVFNSQPAGVSAQRGSLKFYLPIRITAQKPTYANANSYNANLAYIMGMEIYDVPISATQGNLYNSRTPETSTELQGTIDYTTGNITLRPQAKFNRWIKTTKVQNGEGYYGHLFKTTVDSVVQDSEVVTEFSEVSVGSVNFRCKTVAENNIPVESSTVLSGYTVLITSVPGYTLAPDKISFRAGDNNYSLNEGNIVRTSMGASAGQVVGSYEQTPSGVELLLTGASWAASGIDNFITWLMVGVNAIEVPQNNFVFLTPVAPLRNGTFQLNLHVDSEWMQFMADEDGEFFNDWVSGRVNFLTGLVQLNLFNTKKGLNASQYRDIVTANTDLSVGSDLPPQLYERNPVNNTYDVTIPVWATPSSVRYNAIGLTYLPLDAGILKLDPIRLPADGRVPCYRTADVVVLSKTIETVLESPLIGNTGNVGESLLSHAKVTDSEGRVVGTTEIAVDLDTGAYEILPEFVGSAYTFPITITVKAQDMALLSDVQVSGQLTLSAPLLHDYDEGDVVSSAIILGDKAPRVYNYFEQQTWDNTWSEAPKGNPISAKYNFVSGPITVDNAGAIKERWALVFTSANAFRIIGETVGEIGTGNTSSVCSPINSLTNEPYFSIPATVGYGVGWSGGNVLRFNTESSSSPIWLARTILQGHSSKDQDGFTMQLRADIDNEN